jgi:hypothetical protein
VALEGHCTFYARPWLVSRCNSWRRISVSCCACSASSIPVRVVLGSFLSPGGRLLVGRVRV